MFNFEGLEEGELERQMEILSSSKHPKKYSHSEVHSFSDDQKVAHAIKLSLDEDKALENYLRFYASRIIKQDLQEQK